MAPRLQSLVPDASSFSVVSARTDVAFTHIPKAGGSAIEKAAWRDERLPWGIFYERRWVFSLQRACCGRILSHGPCAADSVNETCLRSLAGERGDTTSCATPSGVAGPRPRGEARHVRPRV